MPAICFFAGTLFCKLKKLTYMPAAVRHRHLEKQSQHNQDLIVFVAGSSDVLAVDELDGSYGSVCSRFEKIYFPLNIQHMGYVGCS